jgi:hypothetical protein
VALFDGTGEPMTRNAFVEFFSLGRGWPRRSPRSFDGRYRVERMSTVRLFGAAALAAFLAFSWSGCAGLFCIACDGSLVVAGRVVGIQSPERSRLCVAQNEDVAVPEGAVAINGCSVTLEPWSPSQQPSPKERARRSWHTQTDPTGVFRLGGVSKPGTYPATLTVSCPGYQFLRSGFVHDSQRPHHVVAVMSR